MPRRSWKLPAVAGLALFITASLAGASQPFEGTRWKVKVTPDDAAAQAGQKEFDTVLTFTGGKFISEACAKHGYQPVEYNEEMSPGGFAATFTAEPKSKDGESAKWRGTKSAADMRGEVTFTKKDGTTMSFTFQGERMPQK